MTTWIWLSFIALILSLIAVDLGIFHRKAHTPTFGEALGWTLFWVMLSLGFNVGVYFLYQAHGLDGSKAALEFFAGYLIEKSLSLDNIFVIALIFSYFQVPLMYQHRTLAWGVCGAIVLRMIMILSGIALVTKFSWLIYVFGVFLIVTAIKMLFETPEAFDPNRHLAIRLARKFIPVTSHFDKDHFFTKNMGKWAATPLFIALLQIEATDLLFAIDSIPAIFAVTLDPFIVFTSNIFAILGLRALYFALAGLIEKFRFLKVSLVLVLFYVGAKMLLAHFIPIPLILSLGIIISILCGGAIASMLAPPRVDTTPSPLSRDLQELALLTWTQGRRIIMMVFGITILLIGLAMIVLPGPAILFIPLGLAILAREFVWANKLLKKIKAGGNRLFGRKPPP